MLSFTYFCSGLEPEGENLTKSKEAELCHLSCTFLNCYEIYCFYQPCAFYKRYFVVLWEVLRVKRCIFVAVTIGNLSEHYGPSIFGCVREPKWIQAKIKSKENMAQGGEKFTLRFPEEISCRQNVTVRSQSRTKRQEKVEGS